MSMKRGAVTRTWHMRSNADSTRINIIHRTEQYKQQALRNNRLIKQQIEQVAAKRQ